MKGSGHLLLVWPVYTPVRKVVAGSEAGIKLNRYNT
jgi:hypothetical protein